MPPRYQKAKSFSSEVEQYLSENHVKFSTNHKIEGRGHAYSVPIFVNGPKNSVILPLSASGFRKALDQTTGFSALVVIVRALQPVLQFVAVIDDRKADWQNVWEESSILGLDALMMRVVLWGNRRRILALVGGGQRESGRSSALSQK